MIDFFVSLPTWMLIRVFGMSAYIVLFLGMALGILYSYPQWKGARKAQMLRWHKFANITGTGLALLHTVLLIIDTFMPFDWAELVLPFSAKHNPILNGIGTLALYGLLLVLFTTDIRNMLKRKVWLAFHFLSYPIYILCVCHGFLLGSDSKLGWVSFMYGATVLILIVLTAARFLMVPRKRQLKSVHVSKQL
ncbi:ferric reductase-like transmembrane domain-containing protein [Paenibacillus roseipurpureus]|uniref:Ferric reductase-like transmembrane domain-containing protein n=1 Tax=Paenibacillus roseopurpureus TaxID=2918901 RepID=A0AA96LPC3_9BACL|nr:ferric reductase-like transmembrane domain-containing protein [Paenibacillus sp. MBLB1832]WNR43363.1 ferric reductase-like transmembrane domain-containing protein [Paenibacillus sp. MBLB1832]